MWTRYTVSEAGNRGCYHNCTNFKRARALAVLLSRGGTEQVLRRWSSGNDGPVMACYLNGRRV